MSCVEEVDRGKEFDGQRDVCIDWSLAVVLADTIEFPPKIDAVWHQGDDPGWQVVRCMSIAAVTSWEHVMYPPALKSSVRESARIKSANKK